MWGRFQSTFDAFLSAHLVACRGLSLLQLAQELCSRFPAHAADIKAYFALAERVQLRFALWLASAMLPMALRLALLRSPLFAIWRRWAGVTAEQALDTVMPGESSNTKQLKSFVTGLWLDTGSPPSRLSFWLQTAVFGGFQKLGTAYPEGGPQEMALSMVEAIEARGGAVFVRAPVSAIQLDASGAATGVVLDDGTVVRARRVVSGLGYRATLRLLPTKVAPARPLRTRQSTGFVMANIALEGTAEELGITSANLWLQPASADNGCCLPPRCRFSGPCRSNWLSPPRPPEKESRGQNAAVVSSGKDHPLSPTTLHYPPPDPRAPPRPLPALFTNIFKAGCRTPNPGPPPTCARARGTRCLHVSALTWGAGPGGDPFGGSMDQCGGCPMKTSPRTHFDHNDPQPGGTPPQNTTMHCKPEVPSKLEEFEELINSGLDRAYKVSPTQKKN